MSRKGIRKVTTHDGTSRHHHRRCGRDATERETHGGPVAPRNCQLTFLPPCKKTRGYTRLRTYVTTAGPCQTRQSSERSREHRRWRRVPALDSKRARRWMHLFILESSRVKLAILFIYTAYLTCHLFNFAHL